jgi:hypothetical protein
MNRGSSKGGGWEVETKKRNNTLHFNEPVLPSSSNKMLRLSSVAYPHHHQKKDFWRALTAQPGF